MNGEDFLLHAFAQRGITDPITEFVNHPDPVMREFGKGLLSCVERGSIPKEVAIAVCGTALLAYTLGIQRRIELLTPEELIGAIEHFQTNKYIN